VSENWPTPQANFPLEALTIVAPGGVRTNWHQPVVWTTTPTSGVNANVFYSTALMEIDLQIDVWSQYEDVRDSVSSWLTPQLNKCASVSLGLTTFPELASAPGLVIQIPLLNNVQAEFLFDSTPRLIENPGAAMTGDWRATWLGTATVHFTTIEQQAMMQTILLNLSINGATVEVTQLAP